jgi:GlcNAc-P-P-Und epimerase
MNKILITGASGFIGAHAVRYFSEAGWTVVGTDLTRGQHLNDVEFFVCDLLDRSRLSEIVTAAKPNVLLHLGAETRVAGLKWEDYAANVAGVANVVTAATATSSCKRVVFTSTRLICPVYDPGRTTWDYRPPNLYGASKVEGEKIVRNGAGRVPWVLVRPTGIWGPGFKSPSYRDFFVQIRLGRYFHVKRISPRRTFGFVGNTVYQLYKIVNADAPAVERKVFYLGDYKPLLVREWAEQIADQFGVERLRELPSSILKTAAKLGDALAMLRVTGFPLNTSRYRNMTADSVYDLTELEKIAPLLPYSLARATEVTTRWMRNGEKPNDAVGL